MTAAPSPRPAAAAIVEEPWSVVLPGDDRAVAFEPLDVERHLALVHGWMHQPHVEPWWRLAEPVDEVAAHLRGQLALPHVRAWVVAADGEPFGYVETYTPALDPLAEAVVAAGLPPLTPHDRGWHVLVGPPGAVGTGLARLLGRAVLARAFVDPTVERVVCEPDERNARMLRYCAALGHDDLGHLPFGPKVAALLACTRAAFSNRFPHDVAAVAASIPTSSGAPA